MTICPLCNGLRQVQIACPNCGNMMEDMGKLADYFGGYSPYMDIDMMKLVDGYVSTYREHKCPHLFYCPLCQTDNVYLIEE